MDERIARLRRDLSAVRARGHSDLVTLQAKEYCDLLDSLLTLVEDEAALFTRENLYVIWTCLMDSTNPAAHELASKVKELADKRIQEGLL